MLKHLHLVCLSVLASSLSPSPSAADGPRCDLAAAAMRSASAIRKLPIKKPVPCYSHDKEKIKSFILHTLNTKIPKGRLESEAEVYKAIGFIPEDFDYVNGIVDLYVSQIGGYYDPDKEHYIMANWIPTMMQTPIAVHELTHALQDQYYALETFIDIKKETGDALLARSALAEGDATAVMQDYVRTLAGKPLLREQHSVEGLMLQNVVSVGVTSGEIPETLRHLILFPYTSGLRFAHYLLRKGDYPAIDAAFRRPPRSTEEILHPEKYDQREPDFELPPHAEVGKERWSSRPKVVYSDTMGEFMVSLLIARHLGDRVRAIEAATGWGGDTLVKRTSDAGDAPGFVWETRWDSDRDANEFYAAFRDALTARFGGSFDPMKEWSRAGEATFALKQEGRRVTYYYERK